MMTIIAIMRHAEAASGEPDRERILTPYGLNQARAQAHTVLKHYAFDKVLCSPYVRTVQTAHEIVNILRNPDRLEYSDAIESGASVKSALRAIEGIPAGQNWLIISHMPLVAELTRVLTHVSAVAGFGTAAIATIEFDGDVGSGMGTLLAFEPCVNDRF